MGKGVFVCVWVWYYGAKLRAGCNIFIYCILKYYKVNSRTEEGIIFVTVVGSFDNNSIQHQYTPK